MGGTVEAVGSSFSPENEHQDLPWFWFSFFPLPVTSPASAGLALSAVRAAHIATAVNCFLMKDLLYL
jgi:hypothetical protein